MGKLDEPETRADKAHRRWHEWLYLWLFFGTIFIAILVLDYIGIGACPSRGTESSGGTPRWSWVPLGSGCSDGRSTEPPGYTLSIIALGFLIWFGVLVATCRHAIKPSRRSGFADRSAEPS